MIDDLVIVIVIGNLGNDEAVGMNGIIMKMIAVGAVIEDRVHGLEVHFPEHFIAKSKLKLFESGHGRL